MLKIRIIVNTRFTDIDTLRKGRVRSIFKNDFLVQSYSI